MSILLWIVMGALAGWIASMIMGTNASQGLLMDIVMGIIGAVIGGAIFSLLGFGGVSGFNLYSLFVSVLGAVFVIWASRAIRGTTTA